MGVAPGTELNTDISLSQNGPTANFQNSILFQFGEGVAKPRGTRQDRSKNELEF